MKFPSSWLTVRLGDVIRDMQPGFAQAPGEHAHGVGQIRTHNVTPEGQISLDDLKYVAPSEKELEKYALQRGDIVFNNTNSEEWVGKTALYELDEQLVFSNHMTRIRVLEELVYPEFLARYLHFLWSIGFSKTRAKRWVSQAGIDQRELSAFKVPVPSLPEQKNIVQILQQADALRRQRQENLDQTNALKEVAFYEIFGVPENDAVRVPLTELAKINPPLEDVDLEDDTTVSFIPMSAIDDRTGTVIERETRRYMEVRKGYTAFQEGDVLFAKITPCMENGKAAIATSLANGVGFGSTEYHVLRPINGCTSEYLLALVRRTEFRKLARRFFIGTSGHQRVADSFLKKHHVAKPDDNGLANFAELLGELETLFSRATQQSRELDELHSIAVSQAFSGELTDTWREAHRDELKVWFSEHAWLFEKRPVKVKIESIAPAELKSPVRSARHWIMEQLSTLQNQVYMALQEWNGTLIPSSDLDDFLSQRPVEHLEDAHDQLRRALDQLAGVGLIAKVGLPTGTGEYVTGYRVLREGELSKADDMERLGARA